MYIRYVFISHVFYTQKSVSHVSVGTENPLFGKDRFPFAKSIVFFMCGGPFRRLNGEGIHFENHGKAAARKLCKSYILQN